eukprot:6083107-Lingulodinium_polyedra.AAC.1
MLWMAHPSIPSSADSCLTASRCCGTVIQRRRPRICRNSHLMPPPATQFLKICAAASPCRHARRLSLLARLRGWTIV